eukprot:8798869-Alexandrium_andersonii.AAC.1
MHAFGHHQCTWHMCVTDRHFHGTIEPQTQPLPQPAAAAAAGTHAAGSTLAACCRLQTPW